MLGVSHHHAVKVLCEVQTDIILVVLRQRADVTPKHSVIHRSLVFVSYNTSVFFYLFFEAEPFAAILIAHGTHRHSKEFVLGGTRRLTAGRGLVKYRDGIPTNSDPSQYYPGSM